MKTPYILALASVLLMACSSQPAVEESTTEDDSTVVEAQVTEATILPFSFTLPEAWTASYKDAERLTLSVPDSKYEVTLEMRLVASSSLPLEGGELETTDEGIQIFNVGCGGAFDCGNLAYQDQGYNYSFQVSSTEPVPENLDGIWVPHTDVTHEDIAAFIATVHLAK